MDMEETSGRAAVVGALHATQHRRLACSVWANVAQCADAQ